MDPRSLWSAVLLVIAGLGLFLWSLFRKPGPTEVETARQGLVARKNPEDARQQRREAIYEAGLNAGRLIWIVAAGVLLAAFIAGVVGSVIMAVLR